MIAKAELVRQLREANDAGDNELAEQLMKAVLEGYHPAAIRLLLQMRAYAEEDEHLDELWEVIHAVEAFPAPAYIGELLATASALCDGGQYILDMLFNRLMNSDADTDLVVEKLSDVTAADRACVLQIVTGIKSYCGGRPTAVRNVGRVLDALNRPA